MNNYSDPSSLIPYIQAFSAVRVLVVGDIMLDQFTYGKIERISPEAPVPILKVTHEKRMLGGAGNVAANLCALGCRVKIISVVGDDANGREIDQLLRDCGAVSGLLQVPGYTTIVKTRYITGGNHLSRVDREGETPQISAIMERLRTTLLDMVQESDIVLISDYNKGLLTAEVTPMVIDLCRSMEKPVIVDPKGDNYAKYAGATLVKPNLKEFTEVAGRGKHKPTDADFTAWLAEGARELLEQHKLDNLLVTLGEHGMALISAEAPDHVQTIPTQAKEVFDVSGAGDTSLATLGAALGAQAPIREAMVLANLASGIVVGKLGTATASAKELQEALSAPSLPTPHNPQRKIITLEQAADIVPQLKKEGKVIGFTNGTFDCCHYGHIRSFMRAKELCDVLIVAVNSDASVKRYKGENRPIQDENTRTLLLASLEYIDYVIMFQEDSPLHIVKALHPDVLAKEGYSIERWRSAQYAQTYGAKIVMLPREEGYSTSDLVNKMK